MRQLRFISLIFLLAGVCLSLGTGCKRDKCKRVSCVNGTCADGTCICSEGYFGTDCSQVLNSNLSGNWSQEENCTAGADHYDVVIHTAANNNVQIMLTGIWGQADTLVANLAADGQSFTISKQLVHRHQYELDGNATFNLDRDEITLNYSVYYLGFTQPFDQCAATLTKN